MPRQHVIIPTMRSHTMTTWEKNIHWSPKEYFNTYAHITATITNIKCAKTSTGTKTHAFPGKPWSYDAVHHMLKRWCPMLVRLQQPKIKPCLRQKRTKRSSSSSGALSSGGEQLPTAAAPITQNEALSRHLPASAAHYAYMCRNVTPAQKTNKQTQKRGHEVIRGCRAWRGCGRLEWSSSGAGSSLDAGASVSRTKLPSSGYVHNGIFRHAAGGWVVNHTPTSMARPHGWAACRR